MSLQDDAKALADKIELDCYTWGGGEVDSGFYADECSEIIAAALLKAKEEGIQQERAMWELQTQAQSQGDYDTWSPLETAPRDGTVILVANSDRPEVTALVFWAYGEWKYHVPHGQINLWKHAPKIKQLEKVKQNDA